MAVSCQLVGRKLEELVRMVAVQAIAAHRDTLKSVC